MKRVALLFILVACYCAVLLPFTAYMKNKPFVEKLGYVPQAEVLRFISADQKYCVADILVMKSLFYFGSLVERSTPKIPLPPDYFSIYKTIETAVKLDPYNLDAYYFAQAVIVWDAKRVGEANALLEYGMKYRTWDYLLPFFAGFNYAYFLKDYPKAAGCYEKAAALSGEPLYATLAGRYLYESGQTELALAYLSAMEKSARNASIQKTFHVRIVAFEVVKKVEVALARYREAHKGPFPTVEDLLRMGYLAEPPVDPYGGKFYIDDKGHVRSTSKFAFAGIKRAEHQR